MAFLAILLSDAGYDISGEDIEWAETREDTDTEENPGNYGGEETS